MFAWEVGSVKLKTAQDLGEVRKITGHVCIIVNHGIESPHNRRIQSKLNSPTEDAECPGMVEMPVARVYIHQQAAG
jgi:hypothetical protein